MSLKFYLFKKLVGYFREVFRFTKKMIIKYNFAICLFHSEHSFSLLFIVFIRMLFVLGQR